MGVARQMRRRAVSNIEDMEGSEGFNIFGDPEELRARLGELANQMQDTQRVAWADNAIKLAVDMTVAAINRLDLEGGSDEQAVQVRDAIRIVFPEAVTLVREAREGLS
jgi:Ethanolamine utilization protein EutJ (predicted chaperonin)